MPKPSTMATIRSSAAAPPFRNFCKGGGKNKKTPKAKSGKRFHQPHYHKRPIKEPAMTRPGHDALLHRLSVPPSSSPPRGLLERIGGSILEDDEAASSMIEDSSDRSWSYESRLLEGLDVHADLPFPATPHHHTPDPGEVERFLESVIGAPSAPPSPFGHACSVSHSASSTLGPPVDHLVKLEPPTTQPVLNSPPSPQPMPDLYHQIPPPGNSVAPASPSTMEECRKRLASVLLISAHARDPANRLDSEQCLQLLSDDHCRRFLQQAKEMQHQLSLASPKTPVNQDWSPSLKRDRVDDVDVWVRNTRSRFGSTNTVASGVSRRDSDITLVDFACGTMPPKAPRGMLHASQAPSDGAHNDAPYDFSVRAAPTTQDHSPVVPASASPIELAQKAIKEAAPSYANQPVMDTSNVCSTGDPSQAVSLAQSPSSSSTDCTQPGTWFKRQGSQYAEIVDVDIEVGDEMFYLPYERQPSRLRMHLRLCSVPMGTAMNNNNDDVQDVIDHQALHWPKKGKLVLQVNPESKRSKTWLPCVLESDPLDVTSCIHPGKNTFRFIQLGDLSEFAFVLVASPPPREDEWRSWEWASSLLVDRSHADPSRIDGTMDGLSEFARLPVNVQS